MQKIFLIEDDQTMQLLLRTFLEIEGFQVVLWQVGSDPLPAIEQSAPDLVITDVNLPVYNGLVIVDKIKSNPSLQRVKVIVSSGLNYGEKSKEAGADAFIAKPYMPDELIKKIRSLLAGS